MNTRDVRSRLLSLTRQSGDIEAVQKEIKEILHMYDPYETEQSSPPVGLFIVLVLAVTVWFLFAAA